MQITTHQKININNLSINFAQKVCLDDFSSVIDYGQRIGIIGCNGSGKSILIRALSGDFTNFSGEILMPEGVNIGYVPQIILGENLSGGERFNQRLSRALSESPNLLLLDEPTNHLDWRNRQSLINMLRHYTGTLLLVSHDQELLNTCVDTLWHINHHRVNVFNGKYNDYINEMKVERERLLTQVKLLNKTKRSIHDSLMKEQERAKNSRKQGEKHISQRKWPTITSLTKARRGETTSGKNKAKIESNKENLINALNDIYIPEKIIPKSNLSAKAPNLNKPVLSITSGSCGYSDISMVYDINIDLLGMDKAIIKGDNASGKSTILKAIMRSPEILRHGDWNLPELDDIGYLDQHYLHLDYDKTAVEVLEEVQLQWQYVEIREHLNRFLLRKNEEVNLPVKYLSGGQKVRLSLALIAAKPPRLLLLDEITNNLDLETKEHLIQVLREYPSNYILICHDNQFLSQLEIDKVYKINNGVFTSE